MNKLHSDHQAFAAVEAILILVIVIFIGGMSWYMYKNQYKPTASKDTPSSKASSDETPITSKSEAASAQKTIDNSNVDTDLDSTQLDADLNSLY